MIRFVKTDLNISQRLSETLLKFWEMNLNRMYVIVTN